MERFSLGETEPFIEKKKNEPKASFPGLGCGLLWNAMWKQLELLFFVLYCFCGNSLGFGLLKSKTN